MKTRLATGSIAIYIVSIIASEKVHAVTLTGQLTPQLELNYKYNGENWTLYTKLPRLISNTNQDFDQAMRTQFPQGGQYSIAPVKTPDGYSLAGNINISEYFGCARGQSCNSSDPAISVIAPPYISIGAVFVAKYNWVAADKPISQLSSNVRFIQRVFSTYSGDGCPLKGSYIDNGCRSTPYYPIIDLNDRSKILDRPRIASLANRAERFNAETYVVQVANDNSSGGFTLYDGVAWGWDNRLARKKSTGDFTSAPILAGAPQPQDNGLCPGDASCYGNYPIAVTSSDLIVSDSTLLLDPSMASKSADITAVPTPALLPGMIATGIYHGRKWRKRKQRNQNNDSDNIAA